MFTAANSSPQKEIELKVQDPDPSHVGRNIVTLDKDSKDKLGITSGDYVEIEGVKKTAAIVWPARPEDEGQQLIRMDNFLRHNAGVNLGEKVRVRRAIVNDAKKVVLAPTQEVRIIASGYDRILKRNFIGRPLVRGDSVWISVFGSGFVYTVEDTNPRGIVKVTDFTQFVLKEQPVKQKPEVSRIAYEDIGGLGDQVQKVRDMIELPMRHPELFRRLGIQPPKGVLLFGPPGTGKTLLAKAVANETNAHFIPVAAPSIMCVGGETRILTNPSGEKTAESLFEEGLKTGKIVNDGLLRIVELSEPVKVFSVNPDLKIEKGRITHVTKLRSKTFCVKTSLGDEILVSSNHPFGVLVDSNALVWKKAGELKKGDSVAVVKKLSGSPFESSRISSCTITAIEPKGEKELFDFTVEPFHNFLAGHSLLVLHNSKFVGEAEERIRQVFKEAEDNAPSIIFFDEIDAVAPKRDEVIGEVERRVVAQLLASMDGMEARGNVIVIAATNRVNSIDEALRRPGRFDREIEFPVPDKAGRKQVLQIHTRGMPLGKDFDLDFFANITHGFVGADLAALVKESAMKALRRYLPQINLEEETIPPEVLENLEVNKNDFSEGLKDVQPSALREVTIEVPNVKWSDVGALDAVKDELRQAIEWPLKHPEAFKKMGIKPPKGVLLFGPPGTGKTLLAKAVATESEANFISIKGPELVSLWVGESERGVRNIFKKARQVAPVIVFFDEIDSIASRRGHIGDSGTGDRMVNQLLTELDGLEALKDVVFIAATNRPDLIDPGLLRPGRIDKMIYVPAPDEKAREAILGVHTRNASLAKDLKDTKELNAQIKAGLDALRERTGTEWSFSGADLEGLIREASLLALQENGFKNVPIKKETFELALEEVKPQSAANNSALDEKARLAHLKEISHTFEFSKDISLEDIAKKTKGFSKTDLGKVLEKASVVRVQKKHVKAALEKIRASISKETEEAYKEFKGHQTDFKPSYIE